MYTKQRWRGIVRRSLSVLTDYGWQDSKKVYFYIGFESILSNMGFEYCFLRRFIAEELEKSPKRPHLVSIKLFSFLVKALLKFYTLLSLNSQVCIYLCIL